MSTSARWLLPLLGIMASTGCGGLAGSSAQAYWTAPSGQSYLSMNMVWARVAQRPWEYGDCWKCLVDKVGDARSPDGHKRLHVLMCAMTYGSCDPNAGADHLLASTCDSSIDYFVWDMIMQRRRILGKLAADANLLIPMLVDDITDRGVDRDLAREVAAEVIDRFGLQWDMAVHSAIALRLAAWPGPSIGWISEPNYDRDIARVLTRDRLQRAINAEVLAPVQ